MQGGHMLHNLEFGIISNIVNSINEPHFNYKTLFNHSTNISVTMTH